jgi:Uncharacterized conserved protein
MNRRFFLRIRTQFDNMGDALINRELVSLLSEYGEVTQDLSAVPPHFMTWLKSPAFDAATRADGPAFWRALLWTAMKRKGSSTECWFILNPGGYLGEISLMTYAKRQLGVFVVQLLKLLNIRVAVLGVSYETLGPLNLRQLRSRAEAIDVHFVRDSQTATYCGRSDIRVDGIIPDLAFNLPILPSSATPEYLVISMRGENAERLVPFLVPLLDTSKRIKLCSQVLRDVPLQHELFKALQHRGFDVEFVPVPSTIEEAIKTYHGAESVISNRLHVLLLAISAGAKPIPLLEKDRNNKIRGIFADLGCQWLLSNGIESAPQQYDQDDDSLQEEALLKSIQEGFARKAKELRSAVKTLFGGSLK